MISVRRGLLAVLALLIIAGAAWPLSAQQFPENTYQELRWRSVGPYRGGRTRAVAGVP